LTAGVGFGETLASGRSGGLAVESVEFFEIAGELSL
jgi:hypothetical protein